MEFVSKNKQKIRKSNIELLRIICMLMVLFVHANYYSLGHVSVMDIQASPLPSFAKALAEQICIIAVNVFVFISGWFGIRPSVKGACALMFQVIYYHLLITGFAVCCGKNIVFASFIQPFRFGIPYWFVVSYFVMYVFTPVMNTFVEISSSKSLFAVILSFYILQSTTGFCAHYAGFNSGYSAISFLGLYLLARYIRLHSSKIIHLSAISSLLIYLLFTFIPVLLLFITGKDIDTTSYANPFVVAASLFFFLFFNRLHFSSRYINYIACSVFSVYLIHQHPMVSDLYKETMCQVYNTIGGWIYVLFVIISSLLFVLCCVIIDKFRICMWNYIVNKCLSIFPKYL